MKLAYAMLFSTMLTGSLFAKSHEGKSMGGMVKRMTHEITRAHKDIAKHQKWMKHHPDMEALQKIIDAETALVKEKEAFLAHLESIAPAAAATVDHDAPHHDMNNAAHPE